MLNWRRLLAFTTFWTKYKGAGSILSEEITGFAILPKLPAKFPRRVTCTVHYTYIKATNGRGNASFVSFLIKTLWNSVTKVSFFRILTITKCMYSPKLLHVLALQLGLYVLLKKNIDFFCVQFLKRSNTVNNPFGSLQNSKLKQLMELVFRTAFEKMFKVVEN